MGYIENGIVVDHIPLGKVWEIARLLGVDEPREGRVSLGEGYESNKITKKGLIKIEGAGLSDYQLNLIALVAKNASVSFIKNGEVIKKINAEIPVKLKKIVKCPNEGCISNDKTEKVEPFVLYDEVFRCYYCGREFREEEVVYF